MSGKSFNEELGHIQELIEKLERKIKWNPIDIANADDYVDKIRNLLKQVLNSQVYPTKFLHLKQILNWSLILNENNMSKKNLIKI